MGEHKSPAFVVGGSDDWADPYMVSLVLSGIAHWSWQFNERIVVATGDHPQGIDRMVADMADLYNSDPYVPIRIDVRRYDSTESLLAAEAKVVLVFADDLRQDQRSVDLMAQAALMNKISYQIRRFNVPA